MRPKVCLRSIAARMHAKLRSATHVSAPVMRQRRYACWMRSGTWLKLFYRKLCVALSDAQGILANRNASCQGVRGVARYWRSGKLPA